MSFIWNLNAVPAFAVNGNCSKRVIAAEGRLRTLRLCVGGSHWSYAVFQQIRDSGKWRTTPDLPRQFCVPQVTTPSIGPNMMETLYAKVEYPGPQIATARGDGCIRWLQKHKPQKEKKWQGGTRCRGKRDKYLQGSKVGHSPGEIACKTDMQCDDAVQSENTSELDSAAILDSALHWERGNLVPRVFWRAGNELGTRLYCWKMFGGFYTHNPGNIVGIWLEN